MKTNFYFPYGKEKKMLLQTFDEQMQDIVRHEYGLHPVITELFHKENNSAAIPSSASVRESWTAALEKQSFKYNTNKRRYVRYV